MGAGGCRLSVRELGVAMILLAAAVVVSGCASTQAFRQGASAAREGEWDTAVEYYRRALQEAPDRPEYRIALHRAMVSAARQHAAAAAEFETLGDLPGALREYRRSYELDPSNEPVGVRIANLQQTLRERMEAARAPAPIEAMRNQARQDTLPPLLDPVSDEPLVIEFTETSLLDILDFLGEAAGIDVLYDRELEDATYSVTLTDVTFEVGLSRILSANGAFYKVVDPTTIVVVPDTREKRAEYEEQVIRTFYVSHGNVEELADLLTAIVTLPEMPVEPQLVANVAANAITVRATAPVVGIIERVLAANDKPRAEVIIDVEILEVNRERAKQYGLDLSRYSISTAFSPEGAPGGNGDSSSGLFNLDSIARGVSLGDFYAGVPTAVINFLEQDTHTRLVAQPQLRGQEGAELTLNLGQDIPVPTTAFTPLAVGGASFNPLTSFTYRPVGVILNMTPRVTYENEIILDLEVENSTVGPPILVAGQSLPTFGTRNVQTRLRLRDGESNLLAGLLSQEERQILKGFPGLLRLPILRQLFSANDESVQTTDIVMLLTPRIVRTHQLTQEDVSPIHIGTQGNPGLTGPPPRIAPRPDAGSTVLPDATPASAAPVASPAPVAPPADPAGPDIEPAAGPPVR